MKSDLRMFEERIELADQGLDSFKVKLGDTDFWSSGRRMAQNSGDALGLEWRVTRQKTVSNSQFWTNKNLIGKDNRPIADRALLDLTDVISKIKKIGIMFFSCLHRSYIIQINLLATRLKILSLLYHCCDTFSCI